jgi:REP element-mobilizing transposase RayT
MSRTYRIKVDQEDTWYHCYNRTAGTSHDRPFDDADKEQFVRILKRVSILYGVRVVAYQVMSNHYHLLVKAPKDMLSRQEICKRYKAFHRGRKSMEPDSPACERWQIRTRDISWFMRHLQQLFTVWYNDSRPIRRRGKLWADRFKHTILEDGPAVWDCWKYIENNPYEVKMVKHPGDYRFSSYGAWRQTGHHPFASNVKELVVPMMGCDGLQDVWQMINASLTPEDPSACVAPEVAPGQSVQKRVRYWVRGLVIGSEIYVRTVMAPHVPQATTRRIVNSPGTLPNLCCWRRVQPV